MILWMGLSAFLTENSERMKIGRPYTWDKIIELVSGKTIGESGFNEEQRKLCEAIKFLESKNLISSNPVDAPRYMREYILLHHYIPDNGEK